MSKLLNNINLQIKRNNCDQESKDVLKLYNALINNKLKLLLYSFIFTRSYINVVIYNINKKIKNTYLGKKLHVLVNKSPICNII